MVLPQHDPLGVIVLGMGRSGTALTASLVSTSGAYVDNSIPPNYLNPRGFWESREVVDINRRVMAALGVTAFWIPKLDPGWPEARRLDPYRARARRVISELDAHPVWVLKDPRFSITLPFWLPLFDRPIRYVVCVRNPLEAIASTKGPRRVTRRDLAKWYEFTAHALRNTTGRPRLVVHFRRYFGSEDSSQIAQLFEFLGLQPGAGVRSVISPELYRHCASLQALLNDERVPSRVKNLYVQLLKNPRTEIEELGCGTTSTATGGENWAPSMRTRFFRVYGPVWFMLRDSPLYARLPRSVQRALDTTLGMWTR